MQIYLVGGAVRDQLLGLTVTERDWVVVGSTPEQMIAEGFLPIGKEFPVFLHPETHEEYALARTERKTGKGYKGFLFQADPSVTLEQDLARRDLTINAIAQDATGHIIDPFDGQKDLREKRFRHVSAAFEEDPVRILRVARLASRLTDFHIDPATQQFMRNMVQAGEVDALVPERVWKEWQRALESQDPTRFFDALEQCGALSILFPVLDPKSHGLACLRQNRLTDPLTRFALALYDAPTKAIQALIEDYRIPNHYAELALLVNHQKDAYAHLNPQHPQELLTLLTHSDALRRPERFFNFLSVVEIASAQNMPQKASLLKQALNLVRAIDTQPLQQQNLVGQAFATALNKQRLEALHQWLKREKL